MSASCSDPDPYAELDYRADAGELSEEFRRPKQGFESAARRRQFPGIKGNSTRRSV
jgi:hypothetical protein